MWLRSQGLAAEAVRHAAAAGDHELVAELLVEHHLLLIRGGAGGTVLRWARTLPEDQLVEHPVLAAAAAAAAMLAGRHTLERRQLLQFADRAGQAERGDPYVETGARLVRAATVDRGVTQAVLDGRRAVELAQADAREILTGALAAYAHALLFVVAYSTLAFVAAERGRLDSARAHADQAKAAIARIGTSRSWLGASASAALGVVLAAEGTLAEAEAERELGAAERFFADEVATVHHTWLLVLLARVRARRGRCTASWECTRGRWNAQTRGRPEPSAAGQAPSVRAGGRSGQAAAAGRRSQARRESSIRAPPVADQGAWAAGCQRPGRDRGARRPRAGSTRHPLDLPGRTQSPM
jgi:ATP/maltotriose-dependent transcriptional regulator MalT